MYGLDNPYLVQHLRHLARENERYLNAKEAENISPLEQLLNIQYRIALHHASYLFSQVRPLRLRGATDLTPILFSTFHKNLLLVFSSIEFGNPQCKECENAFR
jgi:hypothetical protein